MTRTSIDLSPERNIITSLIMSDQFLKEIYPMLKPSHLKSPYAREVASWIIPYYEKYQIAPKSQIQDIYIEKRANANYDEELAESIATFLQSLSSEYKDKNLDYTVDMAEKYLKLRSLEIHNEQVSNAIALNDPIKGEALIANFTRVGKMDGEGVSIVGSPSEIIKALTMEEECLFSYPGVLNDIFGTPLRGDLTAVLAPIKRGKTFCLWFTAEQAMMYGLKVAFFSLEMPKSQILRRAWNSITSSPRFETDVQIPYFEESETDNLEDGMKYEILYRDEHRFPTPIQNIADFQNKLKMKFKGGDCRVFAIPGYTSTVEDIVSHLDNLHYYDNYDPDVVIVDYADILRASNNAGKEYRHQLNDIWLKLRWLARSRNIHVITASQTAKTAFNKDVAVEDIAEDMRKLAHVSSLIGLNQTAKEKENGIIRISDLLQREEAPCFQQAVVLQCLSIGRFYLDSKLEKEVSYDKGNDKKQRGD